MRVSAVVAMTPDRVIGKDNSLPWKIPEDLRKFRQLTMGHPVIMGRKTFESLPKFLKGRKHLIITRSVADMHNKLRDGEFKNMMPDGEHSIDISFFSSVDDAIKELENSDCDEVFIIGGGEIYRESQKVCKRLYISELKEKYVGDTYFYELDTNIWKLVFEEDCGDFVYKIFDRN